MLATMPLAQSNALEGLAESGKTEAPPAPLEQIYREHKDLVFRAAYRVTGNSSDAEDVLQTVFLRLVRNPQRPEIGNLRAYLHRSAVNAALDVLRRRRDNQTELLDEEVRESGLANAERLQSSQEVKQWLRQALGKMGPRSAEMFVLRFVEEYDNRDVARMMDTSPAVVAVMLHRVRARLRKEFKAMARGRR